LAWCDKLLRFVHKRESTPGLFCNLHCASERISPCYPVFGTGAVHKRDER